MYIYSVPSFRQIEWYKKRQYFILDKFSTLCTSTLNVTRFAEPILVCLLALKKEQILGLHLL